MYLIKSVNESTLSSFRLDGMMMRYSQFVPRLYNFCLSLGFTPGKIMPSRAFCSDESQGFPIILLAKHFGAFPFNHGRVGGVVATDRHGPHAHHGEDLLLVQASHVGYDPETSGFGHYCRIQTEGQLKSTNCGKIMATLAWYQKELLLAENSIYLEEDNGQRYIIIDKHLLHRDYNEGLVLDLEKIIGDDTVPDQSYSTSSRFIASDTFRQLIGEDAWQAGQRITIGKHLLPELFRFKHNIAEDIEGRSHLEYNLVDAMPWILTSEHPALAAAKVNTQVEFDRTYRTILQEPSYQGKNLLFISGIHIDISPRPDQIFPLTKFVPWAAYVQSSSGESRILEQDELAHELRQQTESNPDKIDLEEAIKIMEAEQEVVISNV